MPYNAHLIFVVIKYTLFGAGGWGTIVYKRWRQRRTENDAQGWPSIEARVISSKAERIEKTAIYIAVVQYSFYLTEYHYGEYHHEFKREAEVDFFAAQLRDKKVQVRYNPTNPDQSVLEQSVVEQMVMLAPRLG